MIMPSSLGLVPYRYSVIKYVADEVRGEPINIGVLIQNRKNLETHYKFITRFDRIRTSDEDPQFLRAIADKIGQESLKIDLEHLFKKYSGKICLSPPRVALTDDPGEEAKVIFDRFVSIEKRSKQNRSTNMNVKQSVLSYIVKFGARVHKNSVIQGRNSRLVCDFLINNRTVLHSIPFNTHNAINAAKLFDWSARDVLEKRIYKKDDFVVIISEPDKDTPRYERLKEGWREGRKILNHGGYNLVTYDHDKQWQKEIKPLISKSRAV